MTKLITALAAAHRELISTIAAGGDEKTLSSTARKIEATLIPALKAENDEKRAALVSVIMNSGSLKALKLVPANARPSRWACHSDNPDAAFICAQPTAYMREAQKRGFTISPQMRLELLEELSNATSNHQRMRPEALLLQDPVDTQMMSEIITRIVAMSPEKAARVAPAVSKMLKSALKADPEGVRNTLAIMCCLHDPAAAHEHYYRILALFALMGVKPPIQAEIESNEIRTLCKLLFGRDGRRNLNTETGGLEAYIASGMTSAASILKPYEDKRRYYTPPGGRRRGMF